MYKFFIILLIVVPFLFLDWHARMVFLAVAYPRRYGHGKSWNRACKHYKNNWTFFQRLFWKPVFKEVYEDKYKILAYLSYIHAVLALTSVVFFLLFVKFSPNSKIWIYEFAGYSVFWIIRFIYSNAIAKGQL